MAGTGPQDLHALLQEFLDACIEALDTIPTFAPGLGGAPERSFVSPGQSADDCCPDQLTTYALGISSDPLQPLRNHTRENIVALQARIIRCVTTEAEAPDPTEREAAAEQVNADGWALWNHVFNMVSAGDLFSLCGPVRWDGMRSIGPQGMCVGWTLTLSVRLEGYED